METDSADTDFNSLLPVFEKKCEHDDRNADIEKGLPTEEQNSIQRQWETTLPDLTGNPPAFEDMWIRLDRFVRTM